MPSSNRRPLFVSALFGVACLVVVWLLPFEGTAEPGPSGGNCVPLEVSSSTEKDGLMIELADRYNRARRNPGGNCVDVRVHGTTSGDAMQALAAGWDSEKMKAPVPQVWTPTSSLWFGQLELKGKGHLVRDHQSITASALVVAMPESKANALGPKRESLGWKDVLGWGAKGHPNWGRFVLGRDNPHSSTSGLTATIASYHAAALNAGLPGITLADLDNAKVISFVHGVESSVDDENFGDDSTLFMEELYNGKARFISAIAVQEQMVYLYNHHAPTGDLDKFDKGPPPAEDLVAIHPSDGTVRLDHPYVTLPSADPQQRVAADDFRAFLLEPAQQQRFAELGFRDRTRPGQPTPQLAHVGIRDGQVASFIPEPEPKLVEAMVKGWDAAHRRARVMLVLDVSGSMKALADKEAKTGDTAGKSKLDLLKPAAKRGIDLLSAGDEVELWTFSDNANTLVSMKPIRDARGELVTAIDNLVTYEWTSLYHTTIAAKNAMTNSLDANKINAVVIMSDGKNDDPYHPEDLDTVLKAIGGESQVRIYTIAYGEDADRGTLERIAAAGGGKSYDATDPTNVEKIFVNVFKNF